jgi:8-oxo-dGTP pyrophosphatase MutT (NUDIX family)
VDERPIREAAAAICVRDGRSGEPEVLVVRRSAQSRFLPGYVSFPGGALEPEDRDHAARWFGDERERHRAAAIRELIEEVGIAVTADGAVASDTVGILDGASPDPSALRQMCRWVAPPEVPVRFDARYFVIAIGDAEPAVDGREVADAWWTSPRRLLAGWSDGEHKLYWPTWFTVGRLVACADRDAMLALRFEPREPTAEEESTMPRHVMEQVS